MRNRGSSKIKDAGASFALGKAKAFCAYRERCLQEVREKLCEWGTEPEAMEKIIAGLEEGNYLNEERYAKLFAGGKFRIKKWGRVKIKAELRKRKIPEHIIGKAMDEIDDREYIKVMKGLIGKKYSELKDKDLLVRQGKVIRFAVSKGFETDLVVDAVKGDY